MPNPFARTTLLLSVALLARTAPLAAQEKTQQPLNIESFEAVKAVSDPQIAPSGASVLFSVRTTNLASNSRSSMTYKVAASGGAPEWPGECDPFWQPWASVSCWRQESPR